MSQSQFLSQTIVAQIGAIVAPHAAHMDKQSLLDLMDAVGGKLISISAQIEGTGLPLAQDHQPSATTEEEHQHVVTIEAAPLPRTETVNSAGKKHQLAARTAPAVAIKKSVTPDKIICLHCAKPFDAMRKHLDSAHGQTPDEYRAYWNLPADYPLVAPNYSAHRQQIAKNQGFGKRVAKPAVAAKVDGRSREARAARAATKAA